MSFQITLLSDFDPFSQNGVELFAPIGFNGIVTAKLSDDSALVCYTTFMILAAPPAQPFVPPKVFCKVAVHSATGPPTIQAQ